MKVTYNEYLPLDGVGTLLHPAYKWLRKERTETCHHITKACNLYYMMSAGGYVIHSVEVEKITKIEFEDIIVSCTHSKGEPYPFSAVWDRTNGEHYMNQGSVEFCGILESINQYMRDYSKGKNQMGHVH